MKIGMMTNWNAANGPSVHAELIGRSWVRMGHEVIIFSAQKHPDARPTSQKDEDYVIRHFSVDQVRPTTRDVFFYKTPLLTHDFDVFIAQNVERLPTRELLQIYPKIKEKALTVQIVHEGKTPEDPRYKMFDWDLTICFDERYKSFLVNLFPIETIHIVPYPCVPLNLGNKHAARKKLGLQQEIKIVFSFGFRPREILAVLPTLKILAEQYSLKYLIIANPASDIHILEKAREVYDFIDLQIRPLPREELYTTLHAADALLIHRESTQKYFAVISSSVCQTLGSGCPILFHESNYIEHHGKEIFKYRDFEELRTMLIEVFEGKYDFEVAKAYLEERSADKIANNILRLIQQTLTH